MTHLLFQGLALSMIPLHLSHHLNPLHHFSHYLNPLPQGLGGSPLLLSHTIRTLRVRHPHWCLITFHWTKPVRPWWTQLTHSSLRVRSQIPAFSSGRLPQRRLLNSLFRSQRKRIVTSMSQGVLHVTPSRIVSLMWLGYHGCVGYRWILTWSSASQGPPHLRKRGITRH